VTKRNDKTSGGSTPEILKNMIRLDVGLEGCVLAEE
jgi:hypothetical protein